MPAIRLPESIEHRLNTPARDMGRAKSMLARARLNRKAIPLDEVEGELGRVWSLRSSSIPRR
jgi:predicted DNA-binding protein